MDPWEQLASDLAAGAGIAAEIYPEPPSGAVAVPAAIVAPDSPWMEPGKSFSSTLERYSVWAVVQAGAPVSALRDLARAIVAAVGAGGKFRYVDTGAPTIVRVGGVDYLAAAVRLITEV